MKPIIQHTLPPQWQNPQRTEQQIYWQAYVGRHCVETGVRSSSDCKHDTLLMTRVLEFKYAALRQRKVLVVDFVPTWKAWICTHILRMHLR